MKTENFKVRPETEQEIKVLDKLREKISDTPRRAFHSISKTEEKVIQWFEEKGIHCKRRMGGNYTLELEGYVFVFDIENRDIINGYKKDTTVDNSPKVKFSNYL